MPPLEKQSYRYLTLVLSATSLIIVIGIAVWEAYQYAQSKEVDLALAYARGFFSEVDEDAIEEYYALKAQLGPDTERLPPSHALILFDYYAQAVNCVDKRHCDQELFCEFMGADLDTLLMYHGAEIESMMKKIYPVVDYYSEISKKFEALCVADWEAQMQEKGKI